MVQRMAIKIYKGIILHYFDYGEVVYVGTKQELLNKLQEQQNRALKICVKVDKDIQAKTKVKLLTNRRTIHLKLLAFSYSKDNRYVT